MKRLKHMKLNAQLVAVFFIAVLLMSLGHFILYAHLLNTMEQEETIINQERMENVQVKLDAVFNESEKAALEILTATPFRTLTGIPVSDYGLITLQKEADEIMNDVEHISRWFIMLEGNDKLLTSNGVSSVQTYFEGMCISEDYTAAFWNDMFLNKPGKFYHTAQTFSCRSKVGRYENLTLMPMSFQSHYDRQLMVVVLLDVRKICKEDT